MIKVQFGCAWCAPRGWRNFDASPALRFEKIPVIGRLYTKNHARFPDNAEYGDVVKGLPFRDGSVDVVYCAHVLEHLSLEDARTALAETFRILRPGGVFRMVPPDLEAAIRNYQNKPGPGAAHRFMEETLLGEKKRARGIMAFLDAWIGFSRHRWMWDFETLRMELELAGFTGVRRAVMGDSVLADFSDIEESARWTGFLGAECVKASGSGAAEDSR